jgi:GT2 family glycosyltransferase
MMARILVGAPTYNTEGRLPTLFESYHALTPPAWKKDCLLVGLDDGSPNDRARDEAKLACLDNGAEFIQHETNRGIPAAWNSLARFAETEFTVIFNDDIEIIDASWLQAAVFFLEQNPIVGVVGWPTINMDPVTKEVYYRQDEDAEEPGACGAPVGCAFAFRRADFDAVGGFWEELISFYEETDFGFEMWKLGRRNYMLPWPAVTHWHSQTFAKNPELNVTELEDGTTIGRMDRSRRMFAEKWGCPLDTDSPQNMLHEKYLDPTEAVPLTWLMPDGVAEGPVR